MEPLHIGAALFLRLRRYEHFFFGEKCAIVVIVRTEGKKYEG